MSVSTRLYKTIPTSTFASMEVKYEAKYTLKKGKETYELFDKPLDFSDNNYERVIIDEYLMWDKGIDPLNMLLNIEIAYPNLIFKEKYCCEDALIGVGITWNTKTSRIKKCKKIGTISKDSVVSSFENIEIELTDFSNNINFEIVFYVEKPGTLKQNKYANDVGIIIGDFTLLQLINIDGDGSTFPISIINDEKYGLWTYRCEVNDIHNDVFNIENLGIMLNKAHKDYKKLDSKSKDFDPVFLMTVMSFAISSIIIDLKSKFKDIDLTDECEPDSVLSILKYYKDKLNIDVDGEYVDIINSVQNYIKKVKYDEFKNV